MAVMVAAVAKMETRGSVVVAVVVAATVVVVRKEEMNGAIVSVRPPSQRGCH